MDRLHPFIYDEQYPFVFCSECACAVLRESTAKHLRDAHKDIEAIRRRTIQRAVQELPLGGRGATGELFTIPASHLPAIPYLGKAKEDGLKCSTCGWITVSRDRMRKHQRQAHNLAGGQASGDGGLWRSGVRYQRLFQSGTSSGKFEVEGEGPEAEEDASSRENFLAWLERSSYDGEHGEEDGEGSARLTRRQAQQTTVQMQTTGHEAHDPTATTIGSTNGQRLQGGQGDAGGAL